MAAKYSLTDIAELGNRKVFFDANVLIYLFWPSGNRSWHKSYSSAFKKLLSQKNELLVDFIVISEIINRTHRLECNKHLIKNKKTEKASDYYKQLYRNSADGEEALADIYQVIETNILAYFTIVGKAFTKADIRSFLTHDLLDFSDKGILITCKENACVLLTNDADFKAADIDILSDNPAILNYV